MSDYKKRMIAKKSYIDKQIQITNIEKSLIILLTGNGKGKTSSALGMIMRFLGWEKKIVIVQFLKGNKKTGENLFLAQQKNVKLITMQSGFTWETQNKEIDKKNALITWQQVCPLFLDKTIDLIVLDELTYMLNYKYLSTSIIIDTILRKHDKQHIIITGRAAGKELVAIADTVSEVINIKHAFNSKVKAQAGIDY